MEVVTDTISPVKLSNLSESEPEEEDPYESDDDFPINNPVYLALTHSDVDALNKALVAEKIDETNINERVTGCFDLNYPPLHLAFLLGSNTDCIMALLDKGADLLKESTFNPIDLAIAGGHARMLYHFIIEYKNINPDALKKMLNKPTYSDLTPLHNVMLMFPRTNFKELVQAMLDGGARALCTDDRGRRPSQICDHEEVKSLLLDHEMQEERELNANTTNNKRMKLSEYDIPLSGSRSFWPSPASGVVPAQNVAPPYGMQGVNDSSTAQASDFQEYQTAEGRRDYYNKSKLPTWEKASTPQEVRIVFLYSNRI